MIICPVGVLVSLRLHFCGMVSARTIKLWSLKVQTQTTSDENTLTLSTRIRRRFVHFREFSTKEKTQDRRIWACMYIYRYIYLLLLTARNYFQLFHDLFQMLSLVKFLIKFLQTYAYIVYVLGWNGAREEALPFRWPRRCKESNEFQLLFV